MKGKINRRQIRNRPILVILIGLFLVWNLVWATNYYVYYKHVDNYDKDQKSYSRDDGTYTYTIVCPSYFELTGNFAITTNDKNNLFLIIWPSVFGIGKEQYGVIIADDKTKEPYSFYVTEDLEYIPSEEMGYSDKECEYLYKLINKYQVNLQEMKKLALEEWVL